MKIGFIGLGNVGSKLSGSLLRNKIDLTVYVEFSKNLRGICEEFSAALIKIEILFLSRIER